MTHFDEMSCLLYLDGQLDSLKTKELELHMRSCNACRSLLAALQRESALLHQAMVEEEESVPARLLAAPGRESIPWFWILSLGSAALGALTVWTDVIQPWQNNLNQAGFGGSNLLAMLFFSGVFWKGWSEMAILATGLAALTLTAGFVVLLWRRRRHLKPVALVMCGLAAMLALPSGASAAEIIKGGDEYILPAGETVKNDLIIFGGTIQIAGTLDGDLIAFAETVEVKGQVTGDIIVFAKRLTVSGTVEGSLRSFANSATISGQVTRGFTAFLETIEFTRDSKLGRGAMVFGDSMRFSGRIERDLMLFGKRVNLDGFVGGNFYLRGDRLRIGPQAEILGTAKYQGRREPEVVAGAKLAKLEKIASDRRPAYLTFGFYWDLVLGYASILALGTVIMLISPRAFREVTRSARRPSATMGILVLLVVPVAACVACLTLVGFAVGMVSMVLWLLVLYVAQIYVGSALGEMLLGKPDTKAATIGRLAVGLAIIRILNALRFVFLPGLGSWLLFWVIIASWGLGAITVALYEQLRWKPTPPAGVPTPGLEAAR